MKTIATYFAVFILSTCLLAASAQNWGRRNLRIGIVAPLYLDSAFNKEGYRLGNSPARFTMPGMDFITGAEFALDSIPMAANNYLRVRYIDSRSAKESLEEQIVSGALDDLDMIITSVKDKDFAALAGFSAKKNIPFISASYPNDGGVRMNPNMAILNPTLRTHCEALFTALVQEHGSDNIYLIRQPGDQEDKVESIFKKCNRPDGKPLLKLNVITMGDDLSLLKNKLDSTKTAVIIGGSLNEEFAENLCREVNTLRGRQKIKLIGMPNWEGFAILRNGSIKDLPVYFTSSLTTEDLDASQKKQEEAYRRKFNSEPSELFFRGFDAVYFFAGLLATYPENPMSHLEDHAALSRSSFELKPVFVGNSSTIDYLENRHLSLVRSLNGRLSSHW
jgi:hypothetical protein